MSDSPREGSAPDQETRSAKRTDRPRARRAFLGGALAVAALGATVLSRPSLFRLVGRPADAPPPEVLLSGLRGLVPGDGGRDAAVSAATQALSLERDRWSDAPAVFEGLDDHSLEDALRVIQQRARDDYEAGRTVSVIGWMISRTEAELVTRLS